MERKETDYKQLLKKTMQTIAQEEINAKEEQIRSYNKKIRHVRKKGGNPALVLKLSEDRLNLVFSVNILQKIVDGGEYFDTFSRIYKQAEYLIIANQNDED